MSQVVRDVKEGERACRICKGFNAFNTCWIRIKGGGEDCCFFERNPGVKKVVDFVDEPVTCEEEG